MAGRETRFLPSHRRERGDDGGGRCDEKESHEEVELEFLGDGGESFAATTSSRDEIWDSNEMELDEDDEEDEGKKGIDQNKSFWEDQHQLLQATLCRSSSVESRIRNITKEEVQEIQNLNATCGCSDQKANSFCFCFCKKCFLTRISSRLQSGGYNNTAICKTKWRNSPPDIPSGEHNFVDVVVESTSSKKGGETIRVIVELNLRAEFEMARASEQYNRLVRRLPEVFVGKVERLRNIIKIMCRAGKRCMNENKMHMGPWRKQRYMQSKWLGPCERNTSTTLFSSMNNIYSDEMIMVPKPKMKPMASMLTIDLRDKLPNMHCTMVEVS